MATPLTTVGVVVEFDFTDGPLPEVQSLTETDIRLFVSEGREALPVERLADSPTFDLATFVTDSDALSAAVLDASARVAGLLTSDAASSRDLEQLRAQLTGHQQTVRTLRATLDGVEVTVALPYLTGADTIDLWIWESQMRSALVRMDRRLMASIDLVERLIAGDVRRQVVVRSGETLQSIAQRELGDWREWEVIAAANDVAPGPLATGTVLTIPDRG